MVIGDKFVWSHMGKTGGDATAQYFEIVKHLVTYSDSLSDPRKHDTFQIKQEALNLDLTESRERLMNIRRLPSWLLSNANHLNARYAIPIRRRELRQGRHGWSESIQRGLKIVQKPYLRANFLRRPLLRLLIRSKTQPADVTLKAFMCGHVDHWLRQEHLAEDFTRVVGRFGTITDEQTQDILNLGSVNVSSYDDRLRKGFTKEDLRVMYANNPLWAEVEAIAYGNTSLDLV